MACGAWGRGRRRLCAGLFERLYNGQRWHQRWTLGGAASYPDDGLQADVISSRSEDVGVVRWRDSLRPYPPAAGPVSRFRCRRSGGSRCGWGRPRRWRTTLYRATAGGCQYPRPSLRCSSLEALKEALAREEVSRREALGGGVGGREGVVAGVRVAGAMVPWGPASFAGRGRKLPRLEERPDTGGQRARASGA